MSLPGQTIEPEHKGSRKVKSRLSIRSEQHEISKFSTEEFASRITCHGLQDWYRSKTRFSFYFWGAVFILATAILVHSLIVCCREFYINPIQTTIHVVPKYSIKFPKILICPSNFVNNSRRMDLATVHFISYFNSAQSGGLLGLKTKVSDLYPTLPRTISTSSQLEPLIRKQYSKLVAVSMDPENFIPECKFGINSCESNISRILDKDFGICYLVDLADTYQTVPNKGLSLVIDIHSELNNRKKPKLSEGVTLQIMDEYHPVLYGGILISPGTSSQVRLKAKYQKFISVNKFSASPQICVTEGEIELKIVNATYSREVCRLDCIQQSVQSTSNCILPVDLSVIKAPYYDQQMESIVETEYRKIMKHAKDMGIYLMQGDTVKSLIDKYYGNFTKFCLKIDVIDKINQSQFLDCGSKCHRACEAREFETEFSFHKLPSVQMIANYEVQLPDNSRESLDESYSKDDDSPRNDTGSDMEIENLNERKNSDDGRISETELLTNVSRWSNNIIVLDIAFTNLELLSIVQSPAMTVNTLLSNLGGACGLWLGASCITILQFLVFLIQFCFTKCCGKREEKKEVEMQEDTGLMT